MQAQPRHPSADLAATMREDLRVAARPMRRGEAGGEAVAVASSLSADLARTVSRAHAGRGRVAPPAAETVREGRARIEELRWRLKAASSAGKAAEPLAPAGAAAAVRSAMEDLRARLASALSERDHLVRTLESTRDDLRRVSRDLVARSEALDAAEALAAERAQVAEELVAEGEALAEERDQALARILELKSLDEQQTRLLEDVQAALADRDEQLGQRAEENRELIGLIDAQAIEIEELNARLEEHRQERDEAASRAVGMDLELQKLAGTREALSEIQRLIASAGD